MAKPSPAQTTFQSLPLAEAGRFPHAIVIFITLEQQQNQFKLLPLQKNSLFLLVISIASTTWLSAHMASGCVHFFSHFKKHPAGAISCRQPQKCIDFGRVHVTRSIWSTFIHAIRICAIVCCGLAHNPMDRENPSSQIAWLTMRVWTKLTWIWWI